MVITWLWTPTLVRLQLLFPMIDPTKALIKGFIWQILAKSELSFRNIQPFFRDANKSFKEKRDVLVLIGYDKVLVEGVRTAFGYFYRFLWSICNIKKNNIKKTSRSSLRFKSSDSVYHVGYTVKFRSLKTFYSMLRPIVYDLSSISLQRCSELHRYGPYLPSI